MFRPLERFLKIGEDRGADGYIANHPYRDQTFIDGKNENAPKGKLGWIQAGKPHVSE